MSELTTQTADLETRIKRWFSHESCINEIKKAVPRDVNPTRIARIALSTFLRDEKLMECVEHDWPSVLNCLMLSAQTGLEPGPIGHCAYVPFKKVATWMPMYKGLLHLGFRSRQIAGIACEVVYRKDDFSIDYGAEPPIHHSPDLMRSGDDEDRIGAYAALKTAAGGWIARYMPADEIERIRKRYSRARREDAPWITETDEMWCKTVLKRTMKRAPISIEAATAVAADDFFETQKDQTPIATGTIDVENLNDEDGA